MPTATDYEFKGHGQGAWDVLNKSGIIDYLSACSKGGRNG